MAGERLNLTDKASWTVENAHLIAAIIKCECDDEFIRILGEFITDTVATSANTQFLSSIFINRLQDGS